MIVPLSGSLTLAPFSCQETPRGLHHQARPWRLGSRRDTRPTHCLRRAPRAPQVSSPSVVFPSSTLGDPNGCRCWDPTRLLLYPTWSASSSPSSRFRPCRRRARPHRSHSKSRPAAVPSSPRRSPFCRNPTVSSRSSQSAGGARLRRRQHRRVTRVPPGGGDLPRAA
jgi:hypothetical protein